MSAVDCAVAIGGSVSFSEVSVACGLSGDELKTQFAEQTKSLLFEIQETLANFGGPGRDSSRVTSAFWNISYDILSKDPDAARGLHDVLAPLAERLNADQDVIVGAHVLWVDDKHPRQNLRERRVLQGLGMSVDTATSTDEALDLLRSAAYDVVIADAQRTDDAVARCYPDRAVSNAGCDLLAKVTDELQSAAPPMILYAAGFDRSLGVPRLALGMTNRVDELVKLVLDGLRSRRLADEPAARRG